jgi:hypothetical protein
MTNIIPKKVPIGTIATAYELANNRSYNRNQTWLPLDGNRIGATGCFYSGNLYRLIYDHLNKMMHASAKRWGVDNIYLPSSFYSLQTTDGSIGGGSYGWTDNDTNLITVNPTVSSDDGFIRNIVYYGVTPSPLNRSLLFLKKDGLVFKVLNKIDLDFPGTGTQTVSFGHFIFIKKDTHIGIYPAANIGSAAGGTRYIYTGKLDIGQSATFTSAVNPPVLSASIIKSKITHYIAY